MEQIHLLDPLAAGEEDRRQLVRLWEECFEADEPYLQVYREQMLVKSDARTVVLREQGKILGMLTLLPCSYRVEGRQLPAMYLFAVATLPEAPGQAGGDPDAFVGGPLFAAAGDRGGYSCTGYRISVQLLPQVRV